MKNQTIYSLLFVLTVFTFSCSNDDDESSDNNNNNNNNNTESLELVCGEDLSNYSGTICCVTGSEFVDTGETLTYTYSSNRNNSVFNWTIISGSISIISGENSQTVTVEFGNDFSNGIIKCDASGHLVCDALIEITKK